MDDRRIDTAANHKRRILRLKALGRPRDEPGQSLFVGRGRLPVNRGLYASRAREWTGTGDLRNRAGGLYCH